MVSLRCNQLVKKILDDLSIPYHHVEHGHIELKSPIANNQKNLLKEELKSWGLALIEGNKEILVEKIKHSIIDMIRKDAAICSIKTSHYLSHNLNYNYTYLANVFSQETGICLSNYIIAHRIEKAKEMLIYEGLTVSEIAWKLNYSSVAHLSNQFIKVTGLRPSQFKKNNNKTFVHPVETSTLEAV